MNRRVRLTKRGSGEYSIDCFRHGAWETLQWFDNLEAATKEFEAAINRGKRHLISEVIAEGYL